MWSTNACQHQKIGAADATGSMHIVPPIVQCTDPCQPLMSLPSWAGSSYSQTAGYSNSGGLGRPGLRFTRGGRPGPGFLTALNSGGMGSAEFQKGNGTNGAPPLAS